MAFLSAFCASSYFFLCSLFNFLLFWLLLLLKICYLCNCHFLIGIFVSLQVVVFESFLCSWCSALSFWYVWKLISFYVSRLEFTRIWNLKIGVFQQFWRTFGQFSPRILSSIFSIWNFIRSMLDILALPSMPLNLFHLSFCIVLGN